MGVVSHIKLYTEGRATEGAWLDNNVGVVSMIILHRGAGYVKLLCIIVYYIQYASEKTYRFRFLPCRFRAVFVSFSFRFRSVLPV